MKTENVGLTSWHGPLRLDSWVSLLLSLSTVWAMAYEHHLLVLWDGIWTGRGKALLLFALQNLQRWIRASATALWAELYPEPCSYSDYGWRWRYCILPWKNNLDCCPWGQGTWVWTVLGWWVVAGDNTCDPSRSYLAHRCTPVFVTCMPPR